MKASAARGGMLVELLAWAMLTGSFLVAYLRASGSSGQAVVPHLELVAAYIAALSALRLILRRVVPTRIATLAGAILASLGFAGLAIYYSLVLIGLQSWGRVITWRLIATYAAQAGDLLQVLGASPALVAALALAALALLFGMTWALLRRADWTEVAARRASPFAFWSCCGLAFALFATEAAILRTEPRAAQGEPVALTFFPERAAPTVQHHRLGGNALASAGDAAARASYHAAKGGPRPNVVLIVGDALRADRLHVLGHDRETTPYLDSLNAAGRVQAAPDMRAVCAESTCGLMAIAKSAYVHQLTPHSISVLEVLKWHGYRTRMLLGGDHTNFYDLRAAYGGVDHYFDGSDAVAAYMNDDRFLLTQVEAMAAWDGRPEFIQFHLMSAHGAGQRFLEPRWTPQRNYYGLRGGASGGEPDPQAANYYDNGVLQFDAMVRDLLAALESQGYLREAVVIVTGDHGEMLGEHGDYAHAASVREGALRIPFLMIGFGVDLVPFVEAAALTSQTDIAPTVLAQLGVPAPSSWQGWPLQAPRPRRFVLFQQGLRVGAYEAHPDGGVLKYWRDLADGSEHMFRIEAGHEAPATAPMEALRLATLPGSAGAVPNLTD